MEREAIENREGMGADVGEKGIELERGESQGERGEVALHADVGRGEVGSVL